MAFYGVLRYNYNMSVFDAILRDRPSGAYKLTFNQTSISDLGGSGSTLTAAANLIKTNPLAAGSAGAAKLSNTDTFYVTPKVFVAGTESVSFSLEAWVKFNSFNANVAILSHNGVYDGLSFTGDAILFTIDFATAPSAVVSWPVPDAVEAYHVVGVYTKTTIQLYVNGEMVEELELTDEQVADSFAATANSRLYAGQSPGGTETITVDAPAYYRHSLSATSVAQHFSAGRDVIPYIDNANRYKSTVWGLHDGEREIAISDQFTAFDDWMRGVYSQVEFADGSLSPAEDDTQTSQPGEWLYSLPLSSIDDTSLSGIKVDWDADGLFSVESSINGGTFTILTNGYTIPGSVGLDATTADVEVKVVFTGGLVDDPANIRRLGITIYSSSNDISASSSRVLTVMGNAATAADDNEPIEQNDFSGLRLGTDGYGVVQYTSGDDDDTSSIEMWVRHSSVAGTQYYFDNRPQGGTEYAYSNSSITVSSGLTLYVNGVLKATGAFTPVAGVWYHLVFVFSSPQARGFTLSSSTAAQAFIGQVGMLATYANVLSQSDVTNLYNGYFGLPLAAVSDSSVIVVAENSPSVKIYSNDWSISSAGG